MIFKNRCYNGGNKHNFEARTEEQTRNLTNFKADVIDRESLRRLTTLTVYIKDVCT